MSESQRTHYRIQYPFTDRPQLLIGTKALAIINLSEGGLMVSTEAWFTPQMGQTVEAVAKLHEGRTCRIKGVVLRVEMNRVALRLSQRVPLPLIMEEQRYLLKKYNTLEPAS